MNLETLCKATVQIVEETAGFIREQLGKVQAGDIESKSVNSLVSYVDKNAEKMLVEKLQALLPGSTFLTEEETVEQLKGEYLWIIDPLDGTTNFLHQLPCFAVSVALQKQEETVLGVVLEINQQECFYAWKEGGAYLNGSKIEVSQTKTLQESLISTGFPYYDYDRIEAYLETLKYLMVHTRGIRRFGAAAVDLAYIACGRFDAFFEYSLNPWDVAAGVLIIEEAGGVVSDFKGGNNYLYGRELIATNKAVSISFQKVITANFNVEAIN